MSGAIAQRSFILFTLIAIQKSGLTPEQGLRPPQTALIRSWYIRKRRDTSWYYTLW